MGKMVDHKALADEMRELMESMKTMDRDSEEYRNAVDNLKQLYSIAESEVKLDISVAQAREKNQTDVQVQTLKNEAEKDKNTKLLLGTVIGAAVTGAVTIGVAQQCRKDEDEGKPWLSKATTFLPKFKGR